MTKKTLKDFIKRGLYVAIVSVMTFSPLLGLSNVSAATVESEDFNGTNISALLSDSNGFNEGTGSSFDYATENGIAGSDAIGTAVSNIWTSKDSVLGLVEGETGYRVTAMFRHGSDSGYGGLGFSTSPTNSLDGVGPSIADAAYIAVHGGATDYRVDSNGVDEYNHDIDGDLPADTWYSITYSLAKIGDDQFFASVVINEVDDNGNFVSEASDDEEGIIFSFEDANNGEVLYPFFFASSGSRFTLVDDFFVEDGFVAPEAEIIDFEGGDGSEGDPYEIGTCEQLQMMNEDLAAHYELTNDIDCSDTVSWNSGEGFLPIAYDSDGAFEGSLDGDDYVVSDLYINREDSQVGLFSEITASSTITNLGVENADVTGEHATGILVGVSYGTIENSYTTGVVTGSDEVGGMVGGHMGWDTIRDSYSEATVTGDETVGGLTGSNYGNIHDSYATGDVMGNGRVGGLVGASYASDFETQGVYLQSQITNSYATGDVSPENFDFENVDYGLFDDGYLEKVGGLVGQTHGTLIEDSYATGEVQSIEDVGGLVGLADGYEYGQYIEEDDMYISQYVQTEIVNSYALGDVHGVDQVGGLVGDVNGANVRFSYAEGNVFGEFVTLTDNDEVYDTESSSNVGGFVGEIDDYISGIYNSETDTYDYGTVLEGIVIESYSYGNVEGNSDVGGFVGEVDSGSVEDSYARGSVIAINEEPENIGGFAGAVYSLSGGFIEKVYSTGSVQSESDAVESMGGLIGFIENDDNTVDSFWDVQTSLQDDSFGGTGKTAQQMKTQSTFTDAAWNFEDVWSIDEGQNDEYPVLVNNNGDQEGIEDYEVPDPVQEESQRRSSRGKKKIVASSTTNTSTSVPSTDGNSGSSAGFNRSLQLGSSGLDVKNLQQFLNTSEFKVAESGAGSPGLETETFGPATQSALAKFQAANGIVPAAGFFGPLTQAFIAAYSPMAPSDVPSNAPGAEPMSVPGSRDLEMGMSGGDVGTLQQFLIDAGYSIAAGVTGYFGQQTKDALIKYQTDKGILPASGYFGSATRSTTGL